VEQRITEKIIKVFKIQAKRTMYASYKGIVIKNGLIINLLGIMPDFQGNLSG
jgi:hypothetical protein